MMIAHDTNFCSIPQHKIHCETNYVSQWILCCGKCSILLLALCEAVFHQRYLPILIGIIIYLDLCHSLVSCPFVAARYIVRRKRCFAWNGLHPQSTFMSSSTQNLIPQSHLGNTFGALFIGVVFAAMSVASLLTKLSASSSPVVLIHLTE